MFQKKVLPNKIVPHFLKLILQNQVDTEVADAEAQALSKLNDEAKENATSQEPTDEFQDFSQFNAIKNAEERFEDLSPQEVALPGQFYLDKEATGRRPGDEEPTKAITDTLHRRWSRTVWRQELNNTEPVYRLPVLILRRFRYIREQEPTRIGPGTYDIDYDALQKERKVNATRGVMQNCMDRFPKEKVELASMPGPGSYGDPYETYERGCDKCKHPGKVTLFESGPCNVRTVMSVKNRNPGPGQYRYTAAIDEMLAKRISSKGPYNLYSAPRDVVPYGYFKTRAVNPLGPGQYNIRMTLKQELNNCCNHHIGRFSPHERFRSITGERVTLVSPLWPVSEQRPGPAHYTTEPFFRPNKTYIHGFNSSSPARPEEKLLYDMAPDKYRPEIWDKRKTAIGHGWPSVFISKQGRLDLLKIRVYSERVRAKDIPHHQREDDEDQQPLEAGKIHCKLSKH